MYSTHQAYHTFSLTRRSILASYFQRSEMMIAANGIVRFCIDVPSTRVVHEADRKIFEVLDRYARAVPVILVRTMKDRFINEHYGAAREHLEDAGYTGEELHRRARAQAEEEFSQVKEDDIRQLEQKLGLEKDFAPFVYTSKSKFKYPYLTYTWLTRSLQEIRSPLRNSLRRQLYWFRMTRLGQIL